MAKSNSQVAHEWNAQHKSEGKGGNLFYRGNTVYSYGTHFPIARIVQLPVPGVKGGVRGYMFTTRNYSVSTQRHKSHVWRAMNHSCPVVYCQNPAADSESEHLANHKAMIESALASMAAAQKARGRKAEHIASARSSITAANEYRAMFLAKCRKCKHFDPAKVEDLAREHAEAIKREEIAYKRKQAKATKLANAAFLQQLPEWLAGKRDSFDYECRGADCPESKRVYFRLKMDNHNGSPETEEENQSRVLVESSLGAEFPLSHAIKAYRFIKLCRERGEAFERNGKQIRLGHFRVDRIDPQGNVVAGCHTVEWEQIESFARSIGAANEPAADTTVKTEDLVSEA